MNYLERVGCVPIVDEDTEARLAVGIAAQTLNVNGVVPPARVELGRLEVRPRARAVQPAKGETKGLGAREKWGLESDERARGCTE